MAQTTFSITASGNDGEVDKSGASYPPGSAANLGTTAGGVDARKRLSAGTYANKVVVLRFDTSSLGAGSTVTGGTLKLFVYNVTNADTRTLNVEYLADAAIGTGDYADLVGTDASTKAISTMSATETVYDFTLGNLTSISTTAFTKFRLGISGGAPTGTNEVTMSSFDDPGGVEPQLVVDYTPAVGPFAMRRLGTSWR